jgi:hypothetical protein
MRRKALLISPSMGPSASPHHRYRSLRLETRIAERALSSSFDLLFPSSARNDTRETRIKSKINQNAKRLNPIMMISSRQYIKNAAS